MADKSVKRVELSTGVGIISFPRVFPDTAGKNDEGKVSYDIQILIPKTQREDCLALLRAIKEVGVAKWGDNWRKMRNPLRDGDKEKDDLCEDGETLKGDKYPERLGHYFLNARSSKPVGVYDRQRNPIHDSDELYGGCKGKINVTFYPYSSNGNHGIAAGLNGVQKIADGTPFGGGKPSVESMFDILEDDEDLDLEESELDEIEDEPEEKPVRRATKKAAAKKTAAKPVAKKTAAKRRKPEPEPEELDDEDIEDGEEDLYDDLEDDI